MRERARTFLLMLIFLLTAGCGAKDVNQAGEPLPSEPPLVNSPWQLLSLEELPLPVSGREHLLFKEDGTLTGSGGCNRLRSRYEIKGEKLTVKPGATTRRACPDMSVERSFFQALTQVDGYRIRGQRLELLGSGKLLLLFQLGEGLP